jgi:hypothetical protein
VYKYIKFALIPNEYRGKSYVESEPEQIENFVKFRASVMEQFAKTFNRDFQFDV